MTISRIAAFRAMQHRIAEFSRLAIGMGLHGYQAEWVQYVRDVVANRRNETITVEMPRQSGKNEASAHLEVQLLASYGGRGGEIVKCAPTWKPQVVNSLRRFDARAEQVQQRLGFLQFRPRMGYIRECGRASVHYLSADPHASVVGATASLLMEVDEAQDVDRAVYDKNFAPMRASTGAPVVFYGTTWSETTLLEREKTSISEGRAAGRSFRILPEVVAEENPTYGAFVDSEVARLGRSHPLVRTQYFLEPLPSGGRMLNQQSLRLMIGDHARAERRTDQAQIVAGIDFAGADEQAGELISMATGSARDSVALTVGSVRWAHLAEGIWEPVVRVLARYEWLNVNPVTLHGLLYRLLTDDWKCDRVHCDATGIGATSTAFLAGAINKRWREIVVARTFDSAWNTHTDLAFQYLGMVNGGRLLDYRPAFDAVAVAGQESPPDDDPDRHAWWQRGHARLEARPSRRVRAYVPDSEGHDDILLSEMLMVDAAHQVGRVREVRTGSVDFYGN